MSLGRVTLVALILCAVAAVIAFVVRDSQRSPAAEPIVSTEPPTRGLSRHGDVDSTYTAATGRAPAAANGAPASSPDGALASTEECEDVCGSECVQLAGGTRCPLLCESDADCGADEACVLTRPDVAAHRVFRCLRSECSGPGPDQGCGTRAECVKTGVTRTVYRCEPHGERKSGEACADVDYAAVGRCAPGSRCLNGTCYPTTCSGASDCPAGSFCTGRADEPKSCMPFCSRDEECGPGKRCVTTPLGVVIPNILPLKSASAAVETGVGCQVQHEPMTRG
jgi:hypothetical protein